MDPRRRRERISPEIAALRRERRERIMRATVDVVGVAGYDRASAEAILSIAGVSHRPFYALFQDKHTAFLAAYRAIVRALLRALEAADDETATPVERITAGLETLTAFLAEDPVRAEVLLLEVYAAGIEAVLIQEAAVARTVVRTAAILATTEVGARDARLVAETAIGGVREVLRSRLLRGEIDRLPDLVPELLDSAFAAMPSEGSPAQA